MYNFKNNNIMNKILSVFCMCAMALQVFAAPNYTAKAKITITSANADAKTITLRQAATFSDGYDDGYDAEGLGSDLYVIASNNSHWQQWATNNLDGAIIGFKSGIDETYTITVSNVAGSETLYLWDWDFKSYALTEGASYTFDAEANATIENRFSIHKVVPVQLKGEMVGTDCGANQNEWCDEALTVSANNETASYSQNITAGWYNFGLYINGVYKNNHAEFSRDNNEQGGFSYDDQNSWMYADIDGEYTFTWNYATQKLTITFPAAPAPTYETSVTTNAKGLATFSYDSDLQAVENDVKLYKGDLNGNVLDLAEVNYVKANQGVIVYGAANTTYHFNVGTGTSDFTGNELLPASAWDYAAQDGYSIYVLSGNMLYLYEGDQMKPNKAFLKVNQNPISGNAPARISMRFNGTQDVENAEAEDAKAVKFVENGQVFIRRGNEVYNLQGQIVK